MDLFLKKNHLLRCWDLSFLSKLDWGAHIVFIAKTTSKKICALLGFMKFLSLEVALYLYKCTIWPCMEYCCHGWDGTSSCYVDMLSNIYRKGYIGFVGPSLAPSLESLAHRRNLFNLNLFYRLGVTLVDVHLNWLNQFHICILVEGPHIILKVT